MFKKTLLCSLLSISLLSLSSCGGDDSGSNTPSAGVIAVEKDDLKVPENSTKNEESLGILKVENVKEGDNSSKKGTLKVSGSGLPIIIESINLKTSLSDDSKGAKLLSPEDLSGEFINPCYVGMTLQTGQTCQIAFKVIGEDIGDSVDKITSNIEVKTKKSNSVDISRDVNFVPENSIKLVKVNLEYEDENGQVIQPTITPNGEFFIKVTNESTTPLNYPHLNVPIWVNDLIDKSNSQMKYLGEIEPNKSITFKIKFNDFDNSNQKVLKAYNNDVESLKEKAFTVSGGNIAKQSIIPIEINDIENDLVSTVNNPATSGSFIIQFKNNSSIALNLNNFKSNLPKGVSLVSNNCDGAGLLYNESCSIDLNAEPSAFGNGDISIDYSNPNNLDDNGNLIVHTLLAKFDIPFINLDLALGNFDNDYLKVSGTLTNKSGFDSQDNVEFNILDDSGKDVSSDLFSIENGSSCNKIEALKSCNFILNVTPELGQGNYKLVVKIQDTKAINSNIVNSVDFSIQRNIKLTLSQDGSFYQGENAKLKITNDSKFKFETSNILSGFKVYNQNNQEISGISVINSNSCNVIESKGSCEIDFSVSSDLDVGTYSIQYKQPITNVISSINIVVNEPNANVVISTNKPLDINTPKGIVQNPSWNLTNDTANVITIKKVTLPQDSSFTINFAKDNVCKEGAEIGTTAKSSCNLSLDIVNNSSSVNAILDSFVIISFDDEEGKEQDLKIELKTTSCTALFDVSSDDGLKVYPGASNNIEIKAIKNGLNTSCPLQDIELNVADWLKPYIENLVVPTKIDVNNQANLSFNIKDDLSLNDLLKTNIQEVENNSSTGKVISISSPNSTNILQSSLKVVDATIEIDNISGDKTNSLSGLQGSTYTEFKIKNNSTMNTYSLQFNLPSWVDFDKDSTCNLGSLKPSQICVIKLKAIKSGQKGTGSISISSENGVYNKDLSLDVSSAQTSLSLTEETTLVVGGSANFVVKNGSGFYTFTDGDISVQDLEGNKVSGFSFDYENCSTLEPSASCTIKVSAKNYKVDENKTLQLVVNNSQSNSSSNFDIISSTKDIITDFGFYKEYGEINVKKPIGALNFTINGISYSGNKDSYTVNKNCSNGSYLEFCTIDIQPTGEIVNFFESLDPVLITINYSVNYPSGKPKSFTKTISVSAKNVFSFIGKDGTLYNYGIDGILPDNTSKKASELIGIMKNYGLSYVNKDRTSINYYHGYYSKPFSSSSSVKYVSDENYIVTSFQENNLKITDYTLSSSNNFVGNDTEIKTNENISKIFYSTPKFVSYKNTSNDFRYFFRGYNSNVLNNISGAVQGLFSIYNTDNKTFYNTMILGDFVYSMSGKDYFGLYYYINSSDFTSDINKPNPLLTSDSSLVYIITPNTQVITLDYPKNIIYNINNDKSITPPSKIVLIGGVQSPNSSVTDGSKYTTFTVLDISSYVYGGESYEQIKYNFTVQSPDLKDVNKFKFISFITPSSSLNDKSTYALIESAIGYENSLLLVKIDFPFYSVSGSSSSGLRYDINLEISIVKNLGDRSNFEDIISTESGIKLLNRLAYNINKV